MLLLISKIVFFDIIEIALSIALDFPIPLTPKIEKLSNHLLKKNGYSLVTYNDRKVLKKDAYEAFKVIDEAFSV